VTLPVPSRRALALGGVLLAVSVAAAWWKAELLTAWIGVMVVGAALFVADLAAARALAPSLELSRRIPASLPIGRWRDCSLRLSNRGRFGVRCELYDHHPAACEMTGLPMRLAVPAQGFAEAAYRLRPLERGDLRFAPAEVRVASPFGLWETTMRLGGERLVRCFPDFAELADYALFATENRLSQIGVLHRRRRGTGLAFHQLRDYHEGDTLRQIDWKATSRHGRLIAREYEDERDQQIVFLIDCGRRMAGRDADLAHFDEVLNAVMLLAFVALRQGDSAGLMTFADAEERFVPARKSRATVNAFLEALYDAQPTLRPPDYHEAATRLSRRLKRRSLVVVISNLRDEDEESLAPALALLRRRHLVLFANLREVVLDEIRAAPVKTLDDAVTHCAEAVYERDRVHAMRRLQGSGVMFLDVPPERLAFSLVNRYLDLKREGRI
jgi:uncharacterized protein (DUF58 family)